MGTDQDENTRDQYAALTFEDYRNLDRREKDRAVEQAISRLQQRIREMLSPMEHGIQPIANASSDDPDHRTQTAQQDKTSAKN